ncbi:MAG: diguanylate cyclase [Gammaproteobacteria bacterium]|nr:diguanylate cyclase [Gammaproteobacteria bacterium]
MFQITIWSVPPLIAVLICAGAYLRSYDKKRVPGMQALLVLLAAVLFWSAAQFIGSMFTSLSLKMLAWKFAYFGIVLAPVSWFIFAINYTRRQMRMSRLAMSSLLIVPLITFSLVVTNQWHHLIWSDISLIESQGYVGMVVDHGPWFYVHLLYSYGILVIATSIMAYGIGQTAGQLKPVLSVIFAPLVVCLANVFSLSPWNPAPWFDLTTIGFAVAAIILDHGVVRYGVLDALPVVRDRVVEILRDGVVVVNDRGTIIDINSSALALFHTGHEQIFETNICDFVTTVELTDLIGRLDKGLEVTLAGRAYDISSSLLDETDPRSDVVLVFRDITTRREADRNLQNAQQKLIQLAHNDSLTGLHNRHFFMERMAEEIERVRRHGSSLSVLIFDLDHFKNVNDTYGHEMGDRVLKSVADASLRVKRITDVAARIGGEEFALLLPETVRDGAMKMAHRLRECIEATSTSHPSQPSVMVTASVGVATVSQSSKDVENVLRSADEALYEAKHLGRNMVCYADRA